MMPIYFWKAVSLIALCREGPYWPEGRHRAREKFKGRCPESLLSFYTRPDGGPCPSLRSVPGGSSLLLGTAEQKTASASGIDRRKADGTKDHPVWANVPIETEPSKYDDLFVLLLVALNPIRVYESIILSGTGIAGRGQNLVACPGLPSLSWAATRRT
jgi:hypothetical protein